MKKNKEKWSLVVVVDLGKKMEIFLADLDLSDQKTIWFKIKVDKI